MPSGIVKCSKCGLSLIDEEQTSHICQKKETDHRIKGTSFGILTDSDGSSMVYHPKLNSEKHHPKIEQNPFATAMISN